MTTVPLDDSARDAGGAAVSARPDVEVDDDVTAPPTETAGIAARPVEQDGPAAWWSRPALHPIQRFESGGRRWLPGAWYPVALWAFWRVCHWILTMFHADPAHRWPIMWRNTVESAFYYDGERYLQIVKQGYFTPADTTMPNTAFFPGVSWLAWPLRQVTHSDFWTGHLTASLTGLAAFITVWGLTRAWTEDEDRARKAVWLVALMPSSLFLWAFYSEGLFMALGAGAVWADRRGRRGLAALALFGLSTTRSVAILVPLMMIIARVIRQRKVDRWSLAYGASGVIGVVPVLFMMDHYTGDPFAFMQVQRGNWGRALSWPWTTIVDGFTNLWPDPRTIMVPALVARNFDLWCLAIIAVGIGFAVWAWRKGLLPMESWLIGIALIALPLCSTSLASFNRFVFADWVIYPTYATLLNRLPEWWRRAAWTVIVVALLITTYHMVGRFAVDRFVG